MRKVAGPIFDEGCRRPWMFQLVLLEGTGVGPIGT